MTPTGCRRRLTAWKGGCWYLHADVRGYRFSTEASLVKLIQEAETEISVSKARARATKILSEQFKDGVLKVRRAWEDSKVPDNAEDAWLVILHWDDFGDVRGVDPHAPLPSRVRQLWEKAPIGGLREYRNRLASLALTAGTHGAMVRAVRTLLALELLSASEAILTALSTEKWAELKDKAKEQVLLARVAVCNHANLLCVPGPDGLDVVELDVVTQASVQPNQTDANAARRPHRPGPPGPGLAVWWPRPAVRKLPRRPCRRPGLRRGSHSRSSAPAR